MENLDETPDYFVGKIHNNDYIVVEIMIKI